MPFVRIGIIHVKCQHIWMILGVKWLVNYFNPHNLLLHLYCDIPLFAGTCWDRIAVLLAKNIWLGCPSKSFLGEHCHSGFTVTQALQRLHSSVEELRYLGSNDSGEKISMRSCWIYRYLMIFGDMMLSDRIARIYFWYKGSWPHIVS